MKGGKILVTIIVLLLISVGIFFYYKSTQSNKSLVEQIMPEMQFAKMELLHLTNEKADMNMYMNVKNSAPVNLTLDSVAYSIYVGDNKIASSSYTHKIEINGSGETEVSLPVTLYFKKLKIVLDELEKKGQDSVEYKVDAKIYNEIFPGKSLDINKSFKEIALRVPEIKVKGVNIKNLNKDGATLELETMVINRNVFPFGFKNMVYKLYLEDEKPMDGNFNETFQVQAKDSAILNIPSQVNFKEMGQSIGDLIKKGKNMKYKLEMKSTLVSNKEYLRNSDMEMVAEGKVGEIKNDVKK